MHLQPSCLGVASWRLTVSSEVIVWVASHHILSQTLVLPRLARLLGVAEKEKTFPVDHDLIKHAAII